MNCQITFGERGAAVVDASRRATVIRAQHLLRLTVGQMQADDLAIFAPEDCPLSNATLAMQAGYIAELVLVTEVKRLRRARR